MTSVGDRAEGLRRSGMGGLLVLLYVFLYAPIVYVIYASFSQDIVWPFPPSFTTDAYAELAGNSLYADALANSLLIGLGSGVLSTLLATAGVIGVLRFPSPRRVWVLIAFLAPLFVAELLIGISSLAFNARILGLPGNIFSAIAANAVEGTAFAFLIVLAQLVRYDWQMDDAAMVFGATPLRCFWEVTLPTIWPSLLGAFLISFILAFNNLEISFYNLGAIPTLPSIAWGSLRFGIGPELFALAALTNALVFAIFAAMYVLMRAGIVKFGYRGG
jgi:ABC-type spermidine/putrescine transport system permease subunit II